jgi:hypothetical protein
MTPLPDPLKPKTGPTTVGISPKAIWAFAYPILGTFITTIMSGLLSGNFGKSEFIVAAIGAGASFFSGLGAYLARPGTVVT